MKTVVSPDMVAHLWANKSQPQARNQGNSLWFEGDTIYSYGRHFPIARHVSHEGKNAVLITTRTYSTTTSRHQSIVHHAANHLNRLWVENPALDLKANLLGLESDFRVAMVKAASARKGRSLEKRKEEAAYILRRRNALAAFMGLKTKPMPEDFTKAILGTDKVAARRVAADKKRRQKERFESLERKEQAYGGKFGEWLGLWRQGVDIERWSYQTAAETARERDGKAGLDYCMVWPCMLRMIKQGTEHETVQTSWGAEVPAPHAFRIFKIWERVQGKLPPEGWEPKSQSEAVVGLFKVDRIDADGTLHAGCHTIAAQEVQAFGKRMGWEG